MSMLEYLMTFPLYCHTMNRKTWLRCLVTSRKIKDAAVGAICKHSLWYVQLPWEDWFHMQRHLRDAAMCARKTVSQKKWTEEEPLCASLDCRFGGKTGLWVPRHVPLRDDLSQCDASLVQNLWWKNRDEDLPKPHLCCANPQYGVKKWIRGALELTIHGNPTHMCYVVCCETCRDRVKKALDTIRLGDREHTVSSIVIGVEELVLSQDVRVS